MNTTPPPGWMPPPPNTRHYLLQFFAWQHLPEDLQRWSRPFSELAERLTASLPDNPERTVMLRKLLEAKDCAVRAAIFRG